MLPAEKLPAELCLDFANTLRWHASEKPLETLTSYADLVGWAREKGALTPQEASRLLKIAQDEQDESKRVLERGIELREAIYHNILAHLEGHAPAKSDLERLNRELELAHAHLRIAHTGDGYHLTWAEDSDQLDRPLWQVARSAAELLTSPELFSRIGQCADDRGCGWLFIDLSKNHSRRWCDINDCGNRAKQRRHYLRGRQSGEAGHEVSINTIGPNNP